MRLALLQNFTKILKTKPTRPEELKQLKRLINSVLQTDAHLRMAVQDVLTTAVADGVRCAYQSPRPHAFALTLR